MPEKTEAQKRAQKAYMEKFALIQIRTSAELQAQIKSHAAAHEESVNGFINRAIGETMERDEEMEREELLLRKEAAEHGFSVNAMQNITEFAEAVDMIERHIPGSRDKILAGEVGKPLDWEFPRLPVE